MVLANLLRFWVIATLGVHWNVRVVRSMPLGVVTAGPYRFVRHPNYVAVFVELLALPLVHGACLTAVAGDAAASGDPAAPRIAGRIGPDGRRRLPARLRRQTTLHPMAGMTQSTSWSQAAGPAGATLAMLLGRAGLRVDVFEARRFPREKPCGEGMMPAGVACLGGSACGRRRRARALGVRYHGFGLTAAAAFASRGASGDDRAGAAAPPAGRGALRGGPRDARRAAFEDAAVEGAEIESGRAVGLRVGGELRRAALVVGADGLESPVRRWLGLDAPRAGGRASGVRMHFRLAPGRALSDNLEIFVGRGHELYVAPLPDGELLVAGLGDEGALGGSARAALDRWIAAWPFLRDALDGAEALTSPAGRARSPTAHAPGSRRAPCCSATPRGPSTR